MGAVVHSVTKMKRVSGRINKLELNVGDLVLLDPLESLSWLEYYEANENVVGVITQKVLSETHGDWMYKVNWTNPPYSLIDEKYPAKHYMEEWQQLSMEEYLTKRVNWYSKEDLELQGRS